MLVSFNVQNFRSFASRQTISLVAGAGSKKQKCVSFPTGNSLAPSLLRSACLFGSNGSGKSSLVLAFDFYQGFVISSAKATQEGEKIDVSTFKFDNDLRTSPTEFEATFIHNDVLYQYGFAVDADRVWSEWLFSKPNMVNTKMRTLFQREYDSEFKEYIWDINKTYIKGAKEVWKDATRDNALFLSTAIQLKATTFKEPFDWLQNHLRVIGSIERLSPAFTARKCVEDNVWKTRILNLVQAIDINIKDVEIEVKDFNLDDIPNDMFTEKARNELHKKFAGKKIYSIENTYHKTADGRMVALNFKDESDGSQIVFSIAGPWLDVLENGYTLIIDELHNSLHPLALKFLVNLFHDPQLNSKNAQLIFTSHETSVMSKSFMHQDQVWLVEKNNAESTQLIPLSDYKVRDISAFQKAYLDGRYGAVPKLKEFLNA